MLVISYCYVVTVKCFRFGMIAWYVSALTFHILIIRRSRQTIGRSFRMTLQQRKCHGIYSASPNARQLARLAGWLSGQTVRRDGNTYSSSQLESSPLPSSSPIQQFIQPSESRELVQGRVEQKNSSLTVSKVVIEN